MSCGCTSACGCNVVGIDPITAARAGDTISIGVVLPILGVVDTDCISLAIDPDTKILTSTPILGDAAAEEASVELRCTATGLVGDVRVDGSSTAIVTVGPDGLKVDVPTAPAAPDGRIPGEFLFYPGVSNPVGWLEADGNIVLRTSYPDLHDALSLLTLTGTRVATSDVIDGLPSTSLLGVGMPVEATGFAAGTTIVAINTLSQIQVSTPAIDSGADTEVRAYPHGNADGTFYFNKPDMSDRYPLGFDYNGGPSRPALGVLDGGGATLALANMPEHVHAITDPGHDHAADSSDSGHDHAGTTDNVGNHTHGTATPNRNFVEANSGGITTVHVADGVHTALSDDVRVVVGNDPAPDPSHSVGDLTQLNDAGTGGAGAHNHAFTTDTGAANITTAVDANFTGITATENEGSPTPDPIEINPKHNVGRWLVHI